ncbi:MULTISPECIES: TetR/AcrR family transcriptional regulator [Streptomyces]|uniref:Putative TetR family transcriptional regulator n=1 Tax=Streptomyces albus (strain ATCC 21838 / DSM 41398 / FERM P-419 / JCM 4703 / NBRC 107858) TaxID=1081613 RepID=A0A0B5F159_STRA4|nr:TetR/AcrR family transcriptional regulator [Streptomyces sp. SCSIO ZS0520]AJE85305.1 putative TetR family transcriptional regulator [Streptomyces albus]AOU79612.1 putative TetR family transcriptional regulator [Streptomyces albus]
MTQQTVARRPGRRTQQERSSTTTHQLLAAARKLFARDGYTPTSLDAICEAAEVTKGAFYHHFKNKEQLFRAVYEREQHDLSSAIAQKYSHYNDPWEALFQGMREFLVGSMEPSTQRITLIDAPGALGWEAMREIRADCRRMMLYGLSQALGKGRFPRNEVESLASMVYGAQCEAAMAMAHADDPDGLLDATLNQFRYLFDSIRRMPSTSTP